MEKQLEKYFDALWPICRSITGNGLRKSFKILQEVIPFDLTEVPTATSVLDWKIPKEWNINDAYIITPQGNKIAEFKKNNLHVINYSMPINKAMTWEELEPHLHTLPNKPNAIPYLTSYYKENWGFCLTHNEWLQLPKEGNYHVVIDTSLSDGALTYGQYVIKGTSDEEILFSSYLCHPSMANNELSGPLALAFLYQELSKIESRYYTYRFVLAPETIGIIAFLAQHGQSLKSKIKAGYVLTCCGDKGKITYQKSKRTDTLADDMMQHFLNTKYKNYTVRDFRVGGSDERQYCSPGYNFPVGTIMRTPYKIYPEYHTSLDDKSIIDFTALKEIVHLLLDVCKGFEMNHLIEPGQLYGEPMLGKRNLYPEKGGAGIMSEDLMFLLSMITMSEIQHSPLEIANRLEANILDLDKALQIALREGLVKKMQSQKDGI
jgi:aminopeptidase-like protein